MQNLCPLCNNTSSLFHKSNNHAHYQCQTCFGIFVATDSRPSEEDEVKHYQQHQNNIEDKGYQNFVSPITDSILRDFNTKHKGLDFGAGTGPVLSKMLRDKGYSVFTYDPYFHNYPKLLQEKYDYIGSCEVIEHFYHPHKEFTLLKNLLHPKGKLYCMTHVYNESIPFSNWYYKNDPTHVFIYQKQTLEWIGKEFGFSKVEIDNRLIIFSI
ncbi:class I SAM-dependent methyltransferase [Labilibaculum sp.]|uniref:class I SAM-dependent methyltransferase n=1 Tax=Labilibaculum sp. TaxID=2060723 RepID=UPI00356614BD